MQTKPLVEAFFDEISNTISYVVKDLDTSACVIVDSVMGFDFSSVRISYSHADKIIA